MNHNWQSQQSSYSNILTVYMVFYYERYYKFTDACPIFLEYNIFISLKTNDPSTEVREFTVFWTVQILSKPDKQGLSVHQNPIYPVLIVPEPFWIKNSG